MDHRAVRCSVESDNSLQHVVAPGELKPRSSRTIALCSISTKDPRTRGLMRGKSARNRWMKFPPVSSPLARCDCCIVAILLRIRGSKINGLPRRYATAGGHPAREIAVMRSAGGVDSTKSRDAVMIALNCKSMLLAKRRPSLYR